MFMHASSWLELIGESVCVLTSESERTNLELGAWLVRT